MVTSLRPDATIDLRDALAAFEGALARRTAALIDEVAHYPTPIARCDEQLTQLIEQRTQAVARLRALRNVAAAARHTPPHAWLAQVARWLDNYPSPEDADEAASVAHLRSAAASAIAAAARP
ncbi:MAG TPA: hypothetical protein VGI14_15645 [Casimicrobiaceae bacterium]|jgi:hypothetical protein